ncbi:MAG: ribonuclease P protein component [Bacteroidota bacterium]
MKQDQSFPKEEKLKSRKVIGQIFSNGFVVKSYPIRIQFIFHDQKEFPWCQVGVSVPKRNFKKAVDRNRIKRQLREVYRLHKQLLTEKLKASDKRIAMMIIFAGKEKVEYADIKTHLIAALERIRI